MAEVWSGIAISTGAFLLTGWLVAMAYKWVGADMANDLERIAHLHARLRAGKGRSPGHGD